MTADITVSLVLLTWNRAPSVRRSLTHNLAVAGYPIREVVHVDQGSSDEVSEEVERATSAYEAIDLVRVRYPDNTGVAHGYNTGFALASSSHLVLTGCDRMMPNDWLKTWVECYQDYPRTGVISCYSQYEEHNHEHSRYRGSSWFKGENARHGIRGALPVEARIHSKQFLFEAGFWREDFGLYGYEDAEWADRADVTARRLGLDNYVVAGMFAEHLPADDFKTVCFNARNYEAFKRYQQNDPRLRLLYHDCRAKGSPHYNPFARIEPNLLETFNDKAPE